MKTQPIEAAQIVFGAGPDGAPRSPVYDDVYYPRIGALAQARHVFLRGNGLPERWARRAHFVILETGFGLGNNFLATWDAWRQDPARCARLFFVAVERHPPTAGDLARAHAGTPLPALAPALLQAWPPLTPNLHLLQFEGGRVQLLLALGDVAAVLPGLRVQADAFYLDGFAPARNPAMWQPRVIRALAALAAPGATLATWTAASELRASLTSAGFVPRLAPGTGGKREITLALWAPRFTPRRRPDAAAAGLDAVVVGAGLAGAAAAQALARLGRQVTVLERHPGSAAEASGNPAGLFHGTVNVDDGRYARLFRTAALHAQASHGAAVASGAAAGNAGGLLRLQLELGSDLALHPDMQVGGLAAMQTLLQRLGLPPDYVRAVAAEEAAALAGVPLGAPAWYYPGGGWVAPADWVAQALHEPGVRFVGGADVRSLTRHGSSWQLHDGAGRLLAQVATVVLANAAQAAQLLAPLGYAAWPLHHSRGQVTHWSGSHALRLPVAGEGYAIPMPGGLLCGATRENGEPVAPTVRTADHLHNLQRLQRLTGLRPPADAALWQGRTGWRLHADDRLPIAGALPVAHMPTGQRLDQARLLPRESGLFVLTALGARGLTLAPLLARLVAAQATGTPWPLEQDLVDAVDPGRWLVRAARAGRAGPA